MYDDELPLLPCSIPYDYKVKAPVVLEPAVGRTGQLSAAEGSGEPITAYCPYLYVPQPPIIIF